MTALIGNPLLLTSAPSGDDAYQIEKSLRFDAENTSYLNTTFGSGNRRTWTWAGWVKRINPTTRQIFLAPYSANGENTFYFCFDSSDTDSIQVGEYTTSWQFELITTPIFRDYTAWYHITLAVDTNQTEQDDRVRLWVNGKPPAGGWKSGSQPSRHLETAMSKHAQHDIGRLKVSSVYADWYLADVHFIDGLALTPAAFGSFDDAQNWNPKKFTLPTPNNDSSNPTWSSGTWTNAHPTYAGARAFSGITGTGDEYDNNNYWGPADGTSSFNGFASFVPDTPIKFNQSLRLYCDFDTRPVTASEPYLLVTTDIGGEQKLQGPVGGNVSPNGANKKWYTVIEGKGELTKITNHQGSLGYWARVFAIEVDGVMLVDGRKDQKTRNNPNDGTKWSDYLTLSSGSLTNAGNAFNGNDGEGCQGSVNSSTLTFTPPTPIAFDKLEVLQNYSSGNSEARWQSNADDSWSSWSTDTGHWQVLSSDGGVIKAIETRRTNSAYPQLWGIKIDGHTLINESIDNSFHLKFNESALNRYAGLDTLNGKLEDATGGTPLLKTTDDYGLTLGSGNATDSFSDDLKFAFAGNNATGASLDISGSGHSCTVTNATLDTDQSQFYGSSINFGGDAKITTPTHSDFDLGTTNWTIEFWSRPSEASSQSALVSMGDDGNGSDGILVGYASSGNLYSYGSNTGAWNLFSAAKMGPERIGRWTHYAITRQGSTFRFFNNGNLFDTKTHAGDVGQSVNAFTIGVGQIDAVGANAYIHGNIQDFRYYNHGSDAPKYTASFKVPQRNDWGTVENITTTAVDDGSFSHGTVRTDSESSNIVLALPMAGNNWDYSATIRGSGSNITANGSGTAEETSNTQFYGSTLKFTSDRQTYQSDDFNVGTDAFTCEFWFRPQDMDGQRGILQQTDNNGFNSSYGGGLWAYFHPSGTLTFSLGSGKYYAFTGITAGKWYHIAVTRDGSANARWFLNGELKSTQANADGANDSLTRTRMSLGGYYSDSYKSTDVCFTDFRFYKDVAKYTASFTIPHSDTSVTQYAAMGSATGALPIFNTSAPTWKKDVVSDTPTNSGTDSGTGAEVTGNYCTLNPHGFVDASIAKLQEGNLVFYAGDSGSDHKTAWGTMGVTSGKWYWERTTVSKGGGGDADWPGVIKGELKNADPFWTGGLVNTWGLKTDAAGCKKANNNSQTANYFADAAQPKAGDVIGCALDMDNGKIWWSRNGVWGDNDTGTAGNPATGSGEAFSNLLTVLPGEAVHPMEYAYTASGKSAYNFGQHAFKYTAPSGFKALCTQNLPDLFKDAATPNDPTIYYDTAIYTGTGGNNTTFKPGLSFQPDLVWFKSRSNSNGHVVYDAVRGATKKLHTHLTNAEATENDGLTAFTSDGFTVGDSGWENESGTSFVAWTWDCGTAAATASTDGTNITPSTQWVNTSAGFSMSKYTGTGTKTDSVGHALGAKPEFVIIKDLSGGHSYPGWYCKHKNNTTGNNIKLEQDVAEWPATGTNAWYDGGIADLTSNTVVSFAEGQTANSVNNVNKSGDDYIMYAWTGIPGYSKFGKYTGNGGDNYLHLGFRPAFYMHKCISDGAQWETYDSKRGGYNEYNQMLYACYNNGEGGAGSAPINLLSNGISFRTGNNHANGSGRTYIYIAFAEHPGKTSRAR